MKEDKEENVLAKTKKEKNTMSGPRLQKTRNNVIWKIWGAEWSKKYYCLLFIMSKNLEHPLAFW